MLEFAGIREYYKQNKSAIDLSVKRVMEGASYIGGEVVWEFERQLGDFLGTGVVSCANGTDALRLALMALGIGQGDAVIIPSFNFVAGAEVLVSLGATPVFVEVDKNHCIDPISTQRTIEYIICEGKLQPRAIIAVDLFGFAPNYPELERICEHYGLFLIEDAAQSIGGEFYGKRLGSFGTIGTTSFFPTKPLACFGDGGAVFTQNPYLEAKIRSIANHGTVGHKYNHQYVGINSRLDAIQAAILLEKLKHLEESIINRQQIAESYTSLLKDNVTTPDPDLLNKSAMGAYTIVLPNQLERDSLREYLEAKNIPTMIYYPAPTHSLPPYKEFPVDYKGLAHSEELCKRVISLPMHQYLSSGDVQYICKWINAHQRREKI